MSRYSASTVDASIRSTRIEWRKKPSGVWVHVSVYDPEPDGTPNAGKDACKRGHLFTPENTIWKPEGWRQCRTCKATRRKPPTAEQKRRANELKRQRKLRMSQEQEENAA